MKKKVQKKKILVIVLAISVIVALGLGATHIVKSQIMQKKHDAIVKENEAGADTLNSIYLNMGDQKVLVGNTIQVEAYVVPQTELAASIEFSSSDNEVFTVTQMGVVTVNKVGKATLTAKTGSLATSIVIEGVESEDEVESNEAAVKLPQEYSNVSGTSVLKNNQSSTSDVVSGNTQGADTVTGDSQSEENATSDNTVGENVDVTTPTTEEELPDLPQEDLENVRANIENYGFTKCQDSSYAIYNDGEYYGQVIVDSKAIYIGIKDTSSMTDEAFLNVLKIVLPNSYENCFSIYKSASNDRVMTMDNHKVNIMTGGDHTFINIYALDE